MQNLSVANKTSSDRRTGAYSYGYQGSMQDNDIYGRGNAYTTEFRESDVRIGRWWGIDPITFTWLSPYQSMDNNPILFDDPFGDQHIVYSGDQKKTKRDIRYAKHHGGRERWKKAIMDAKTNGGKNWKLDASSTGSPNDPDFNNAEATKLNSTTSNFHFNGIAGSEKGTYSVLKYEFVFDFPYQSFSAPFGTQEIRSYPLAAPFPDDNNAWIKVREWQPSKIDGLHTYISGNILALPSPDLTTATISGEIYNANELDEHGMVVGYNIKVISQPFYIKVPKNSIGLRRWQKAIFDYTPVNNNEIPLGEPKIMNFSTTKTYNTKDNSVLK